MAEALKRVLDAICLARSSHGVALLGDPPQDAWKTRGVDAQLGAAAATLEQHMASDEALLRQALAILQRYSRWAADMGTELEAANTISALKARLGIARASNT